MTQLIFGDPASIKLAKEGEISPEVEDKETEIDEVEGCEEACSHCDHTGYECANCGAYEEAMNDLWLVDLDQNKRCKHCKYKFKYV